MHNTKQITEDIYWVGANDRRISLFEGVYDVPLGVSYNSYIILDEKTVLLDTVDKVVAHQFFENVEHVLNGRKLDYLVINHMEPDHCAELESIVTKYPDVKIVCNAKTQSMISQFFDFSISQDQFVIVKEGDCYGAVIFQLESMILPGFMAMGSFRNSRMTMILLWGQVHITKMWVPNMIMNTDSVFMLYAQRANCLKLPET